MQTFLPYPDFARSAACLDVARLGKQRSEVKQLLRALLHTAGPPPSGGVLDYGALVAALLPSTVPRASHVGAWARHPAARMWRGHEGALAAYGAAVCTEWRGRGYADTLLPQLCAVAQRLAGAPTGPGCNVPPAWLGDAGFHASHRSNLLRKMPGHYGRFGWVEPPDLPYVWPAP